MGGEPILAIAASESLSVRRVQQIIREKLNRRDANPRRRLCSYATPAFARETGLSRKQALESRKNCAKAHLSP
jgi:hypothetical protein